MRSSTHSLRALIYFTGASLPQQKKLVQKRTNKKKKNYWKDPANCRAFFDDFAKDYAFNPLSTEWYNVNLNVLDSRRVSPYSRSFDVCVLDLCAIFFVS